MYIYIYICDTGESYTYGTLTSMSRDMQHPCKYISIYNFSNNCYGICPGKLKRGTDPEAVWKKAIAAIDRGSWEPC